ncbi:hypothetical protein AZ54_09155 [Xanthomonas oryzae pv. oryzae PXO86]|uniref:Uncharacterized protein n=1 Tax=Xanthomonas oryzae pv. oryzae (strain PXO99A) TaxID=360094 RepID=A0A0K0GJD5_XANOP|nr:hypothetical protein PXO_00176 [Xanthomonas oryzae pv. oryzae PXO99A]AJQ82757.1 hypothetical protein AZ54_09155 [Xanthomonas oryzae pv. oryzae PXO86]
MKRRASVGAGTIFCTRQAFSAGLGASGYPGIGFGTKRPHLRMSTKLRRTP